MVSLKELQLHGIKIILWHKPNKRKRKNVFFSGEFSCIIQLASLLSKGSDRKVNSLRSMFIAVPKCYCIIAISHKIMHCIDMQ